MGLLGNRGPTTYASGRGRLPQRAVWRWGVDAAHRVRHSQTAMTAAQPTPTTRHIASAMTVAQPTPTTLLGLLASAPRRRHGHRVARPQPAHFVCAIARAGGRHGRRAGRRRHPPRRPRRHGAAQRPADHRRVPGRVRWPARRRRSTPATRKRSSASSSRTPTPRCCCCRPRASTRPARPPATRAHPHGGHGRDRRRSRSRGEPLGRRPCAPPARRRRGAHPAHERQHRPARSACRSATPTCRSRRSNVARSYALTRRRRVAVRDAALPRARPGRLDAGDAGHRRHRGRAGQVQPAVVLARRAGVTAPPGTRPCRRSTSCCWRASSRAQPKPAGAEKLRFIRSCSASLPPQVMHDLEAAFGAPVLEAYGMTEAAHQMASNPLPPGGAHARLGRAAAPTSASASATTSGQRAGARRARRGRASRARTSITGYENNPEANATAFFDGWFRTGDQGFLDENGYLTLVGPAQGDDQPRRREDLAARDRRGAADAPGGGRSGVLRRAAPDVGRGGGGGGRRCTSRSPRPTCSPSARSGWPSSSVPSRFTSPRRFRARPPARSSVASSRRRSRRRPDAR